MDFRWRYFKYTRHRGASRDNPAIRKACVVLLTTGPCFYICIDLITNASPVCVLLPIPLVSGTTFIKASDWHVLSE